MTESRPAARLSRRRLFGLAGAGAVGVAAAGAGGAAIGRATASGPAGAGASAADAVAFHGVHQAGITTPQQDRLHFVAFDVITDDRAQLAGLLRDWTAAARRLTAGRAAGPGGAVPSNAYL